MAAVVTVPAVVQARLLMPYILAARQQLLEEIAEDATCMNVLCPDHDADEWVSFAVWILRKYRRRA